MPNRDTSFLWRVNAVALWTLIATCALFAGLFLRDWTWATTQPIRFRGDITNALNIGRQTVAAGIVTPPGEPPRLPDYAGVWKSYLNRYDAEFNRFARRELGEQVPPNRYGIDYPPGRLLIASLWVKHVVDEVPPGETLPRGLGVQYSDEIVTPMRWVNIVHELAAAAGLFFLVWRVFRISGRGAFVSETLGMLAALLAWFNPALILNAHGWPQWDAWVLPYVIWGAYFALINRWILTGMLLASGAMLKGQVLMLLPLFPFWAIFSGQIGGLLRLISGFVFAGTLCLWPWLIRDAMPAMWVLGSVALIAIASIVARHRRASLWLPASAMLIGWMSSPWIQIPWLTEMPQPRGLVISGAAAALAIVIALVPTPLRLIRTFLAAALLMVVTAMLPALLNQLLSDSPLPWLTVAFPKWTFSPIATGVDPLTLKRAAGVVCIGVAFAMISKRRCVLPVAMASFAALTLLAAGAFNGSFTWLDVGFQTERYPTMFSGSVANVPSILQHIYRLDAQTTVSLFGLLAEPMPIRVFLKSIAMIGLVLCAIALVIQLRRKDPNALVVFAAAWMLLYAVLPQMHERYLTWAAVTSAVLITRGVGGLLIHAAIVAIQFAMIFLSMCAVNGRGRPGDPLDPWVDLCRGLVPGAGFAVLTIALVLLGWSFRRSVPKAIIVRKPAAPRLLSPATSAAPARASDRSATPHDHDLNTADTTPASA